MTAKKSDTKQPDIDTKAAVQALEYLLAAGYVSKKRLYIENFLRGIFFSVGSILGATIVVGLLLWILSLFDSVPLVGDIVKSFENAVSSK